MRESHEAGREGCPAWGRAGQRTATRIVAPLLLPSAVAEFSFFNKRSSIALFIQNNLGATRKASNPSSITSK